MLITRLVVVPDNVAKFRESWETCTCFKMFFWGIGGRSVGTSDDSLAIACSYWTFCLLVSIFETARCCLSEVRSYDLNAFKDWCPVHCWIMVSETLAEYKLDILWRREHPREIWDQPGFKPTTFCYPDGCSCHWATGTQMAEEQGTCRWSQAVNLFSKSKVTTTLKLCCTTLSESARKITFSCEPNKRVRLRLVARNP